ANLLPHFFLLIIASRLPSCLNKSITVCRGCGLVSSTLTSHPGVSCPLPSPPQIHRLPSPLVPSSSRPDSTNPSSLAVGSYPLAILSESITVGSCPLSRSSISLFKSAVNKPTLKPNPIPSSQLLSRSFLTSPRSVPQLDALQSLLPLHSAVSSARLTSCLGIDSRSSRSLSLDILCRKMSANRQWMYNRLKDGLLNIEFMV
ncbi:uncharacterized protein LOC110618851, partial [Manihot esculenta]|uniref:uncharacterized protein LOC110618851 n=1 Tax=Manihot esculenta TaxID=3983 RepID=UPI001CC52CBB